MICRAKANSEKDGKQFLQESFAKQQRVLKAKLDLAEYSITHDGKRGDVAEQHFIEVLRGFLPYRYRVDSAIVIDSAGHTSDQIDIVVYDRQYTPTLLDQLNHKYIPAEAVYGVFEVKPTISKEYLDYAADKAATVRCLHRTSAPITHIGGICSPVETKPIIAGLIAADISWADGFGECFQRNHSGLTGDRALSCGLAVDGGAFDTFDSGGRYAFGPSNNGLVFFLFRLLNRLRTLGTVPAIDGNAYAAQFSDA